MFGALLSVIQMCFIIYLWLLLTVVTPPPHVAANFACEGAHVPSASQRRNYVIVRAK